MAPVSFSFGIVPFISLFVVIFFMALFLLYSYVFIRFVAVVLESFLCGEQFLRIVPFLVL